VRTCAPAQAVSKRKDDMISSFFSFIKVTRFLLTAKILYPKGRKLKIRLLDGLYPVQYHPNEAMSLLIASKSGRSPGVGQISA
jgi:hypothetical protein